MGDSHSIPVESMHFTFINMNAVCSNYFGFKDTKLINIRNNGHVICIQAVFNLL